MRAIGYFRYRDGSGSLRDPDHAFAEYCDRYAHQAIKAFVDIVSLEGEGYPEYRRMLDYLHESASGFLVVVPDASHLGDDLESAVRSMLELEKAGAKATCDDELPDPLQNAIQTMGVRNVSRSRSARIKASMREQAIRGKGLGRPPYGYRNGSDGALAVVRDEAAVVQLLYRLHTEDGLGLRLIAQHVNASGILTRRGRRWNMATIRDILRNPAYMGTYTRFGLRVPKSHEAIVSPETFRASQEATGARRRRGRLPTREPFLLSGLAYCRQCGNRMMGVTRRQSWRRKDGRRARGVYRYYQCQSKNNSSVCDYHTWRASLLDDTTLSKLREALRTGTPHAGGTLPKGRTEAVEAAEEARVRNAERRFLRAMKRAAEGDLSLQALGSHLNDLDAARAEAGHASQPADVDSTLAGWDSLNMTDRRGFLMQHISRVVVSDDGVEVVV